MMQVNVLNTYEANIEVLENPYHFEPPQLFEMALRINKKRSFLFVSKVLGKHLAVEPQMPLLISHLLAHRYMEERFSFLHPLTNTIKQAIQTKQNIMQVLQLSRLNQFNPPNPISVIGFAETATALAHGFFELFSGDVQFIHTTREHLLNQDPVIVFEEEHSHATSHRVYADEKFFQTKREIVIVDDEMTTGKTNLNIIRQLHETYPHLTTFTLVSILDWRTAEHEQQLDEFAKSHGLTIHSVSLLKGNFDIHHIGELPEVEEQQRLTAVTSNSFINFEPTLDELLVNRISSGNNGESYEAHYYKGTGRFSLDTSEQQTIYHHSSGMAKSLATMRSNGKCLVLGTGEFMYIPMCIASEMGENVVFHSTTRSPIFAHEYSLIKNKFTFSSAEFPGVENYLYNIPLHEYDDIFIIYERILDQAALHQLIDMLAPFAKNIYVVTLGGVVHANTNT